MGVRSNFFGKDALDQWIQATEQTLNYGRAHLENDAELHEKLNGQAAKNAMGSAGFHCYIVDYGIRLAELKHAAGCSIADVQTLFREAGQAFLRIARAADFSVTPSPIILDHGRRTSKKYLGRPGVVKVETFVDEKGQKVARIHAMRKPEKILFTRSLEAALLSGDANLATDIAKTYPYNSLNEGVILRFFVLGQDDEVLKHKEVFEPWVAGDKDGDWPYPRRQFPFAILKQDDSLLTDGITKASKAFSSRWKPARYTTSRFVEYYKTPEKSLDEAKKRLVNMKWLLYPHGLAFSIVAARRGIKGFLTQETGWSEWVPRELIISAI
jgi:hypothetical protein